MAWSAGGARRRGALLAAAAAAVLVPRLLWAADEVARVIESLRRARSFKVRVQAATVLARMKDRRVVPELGRAATSDRHFTVRMVALGLLARAPGRGVDPDTVRALIRRGLQDRRSEVRAHAARSLRELERNLAGPAPTAPSKPRQLVVAVGAVADRTGRASPELKARMRRALILNLRGERQLMVQEVINPQVEASYVVDGSISRLDHNLSGMEIASTCAVQLVISRPPRGIVMVASGEASVLKPRSQFRASLRGAMESEALEHAVKVAHENLARFLATVR